jgi:2'-5' RNA ligase
MRLFVALDIDAEIRQRIAKFTEGLEAFAPAPRWVSADSLHVTLKFVGETQDYEKIRAALKEVHGEQVELSFRGYGFFPTPRSPRVFWIGIEADARLASLACKIDESLGALGIEKESRAYTPHLTLARSGSGRPSRQKGDQANNNFELVQKRLAALPQPEFGTMTAREFYLYQSKTNPKGAVYTKLDRYTLG